MKMVTNYKDGTKVDGNKVLSLLSLIKGDNVLITYTGKNNETVLATFYKKSDGIYYFNDIHGIFAVSEKAVKSHSIIIEIVEE